MRPEVSSSRDPDPDLRFTLYRLERVSAMPDSPRKAALLAAIRQRLNGFQASPPRPRLPVPILLPVGYRAA